MAKSLFRELVKRLRKDWESRFPWVRPVDEAYSPAMPKASTFYAGAANKFGKHIFLNIQHNSKPWAVGDLTVNVIFSSRLGEPVPWIGRDLEPDPEGSHRLGILLHGKDKWWSLAPNGNTYGITWRPVSYHDPELVLGSAVEDVSVDVARFFSMIEQGRANKELKLTKPSTMELRSLL
jgi:hypothetical protein